MKKGNCSPKVNDRPLQAQLQRLVSQIKLAEDRVFRQNALLERDAVSKRSIRTGKDRTGNPECRHRPDRSNIAKTELRSPLTERHRSAAGQCRDIRVSLHHCSQLTKLSPLKVKFSVPGTYANDGKIRCGTGLHARRQMSSIPPSMHADQRLILTHTLAPSVRSIPMPISAITAGPLCQYPN